MKSDGRLVCVYPHREVVRLRCPEIYKQKTGSDIVTAYHPHETFLFILLVQDTDHLLLTAWSDGYWVNRPTGRVEDS